jgi:GT2 family glycosyltransferase
MGMSGAPRVHVLLAVHNRKDVTLACLERVEVQSRDAPAEVRVVLVDDASTDGTASAVRQRFPEVQVVEGSGHLYWNGGMRRAFEVAMRDDPDFYLFLNDDTRVAAGALARMLATRSGGRAGELPSWSGRRWNRRRAGRATAVAEGPTTPGASDRRAWTWCRATR